MAHIKYQTLLDYLEDQLPPAERSKVNEHLAETCQQCDRRIAFLRTVLQTVANDHTVAPPADVLKRAVDNVRNRKEEPRSGLWNRVVASLSFDNHMQLSSAATRGSARARQMLFTTDQVDIDLQIKPGNRDYELLGQMLDARHSGGFVAAFVSLQSNEGQVQKATETDALGQFAFHGVSAGTYDLVFDLDDNQIAVTGLEFRNE
jgi:hypothetical protein